MRRTILLVMAIFSAAFLLQACSLLGAGEVKPEDAASIPAVLADAEVVSEGNLVPREYTYLTFANGGEVAEILVEKGELVEEGQVLARLGMREQAEANLTAAALELLSAQQDYDALVRTADLARAAAWLELIDAHDAVIAAGRAWDAVDTDEYQQDIDDARTAVQDAEDDLDDAQEEFDKYADFDTDNPTRQRAEDDLQEAEDAYEEAVRERDELVNRYDRAQAGLLQADAALAEAQRKYDLQQDGPDPEQMALAQARLDNAVAQQAAAQAGIDRLDLTAPYQGTIVEINVVVNEMVGTDTWVILIADFSEWYVETNDLTELEVVKIAEGQGAIIVPDALPDVTLSGEVVEISDVFKAQGGDVLYQVRILVSDVDERLRWGMTTEVRLNP
ncbi:MAG: efflux RND transporter periplasmic adaptor subunit [Anaerolineales bacterium]|nr:efflux RND transporter periplasmic adaptor subunit [Anaerolineales bacterium]